MESKTQNASEKSPDSAILFSKTVKAGKRIYYIDVKRDRRGELYISMTESKRVKEGGEGAHPVFEKHKIFLYREDLEKFQYAFNEIANFTRENAPHLNFASDWSGPVDDYSLEGDIEEKPYRIDIDF